MWLKLLISVTKDSREWIALKIIFLFDVILAICMGGLSSCCYFLLFEDQHHTQLNLDFMTDHRKEENQKGRQIKHWQCFSQTTTTTLSKFFDIFCNFDKSWPKCLSYVLYFLSTICPRENPYLKSQTLTFSGSYSFCCWGDTVTEIEGSVAAHCPMSIDN